MMEPVLNPASEIEIFSLIHESHHRPDGLEFEYMTGQLRQKLENEEFGPIVSEDAKSRVANIGEALSHVQVAKIITEDFIITRETARLIKNCLAPNGVDVPIEYDDRICESDLSYLDRKKFDLLCKEESAGDPNATLKDWIGNCPSDFEHVTEAHARLWNDICADPESNSPLVTILHVEGMLLFLAWALGLKTSDIGRLHVPRSVPIHIRLHPDSIPVVSFGDSWTWGRVPSRPYGQYG